MTLGQKPPFCISIYQTNSDLPRVQVNSHLGLQGSVLSLEGVLFVGRKIVEVLSVLCSGNSEAPQCLYQSLNYEVFPGKCGVQPPACPLPSPASCIKDARCLLHPLHCLTSLHLLLKEKQGVSISGILGLDGQGAPELGTALCIRCFIAFPPATWPDHQVLFKTHLPCAVVKD